MKRHLIGIAAVVLGTALVGGVSVPTAAAVDAPTSVTLPMFGVPLTIGITTGPGGALTEVTVDPADGNVATKTRQHKVVFESANPDATGEPGKVTIRSRKGGQSVTARAGSLAEVSGPGSWSGDVFGNGTTSTVSFTIAAAADGTADITGTAATGEASVVGDVRHSVDDEGDETSSSARVTVRFTNADGDQKRNVTIAVRVKTDDDGDTSAKLSISLGALKGVAVPAADAAGPHTWTDLLCDGSTATITYDVAEDGTVSNVVITPATDDVRIRDSRIDVRFSNDERVRIRVREDDGLIKVSVEERIRCRDAAAPSFNGSTVPTTIDDDDDGDRDDNRGRHGRGGGRDDDDDATSTTDVTTVTLG